MVTRKSTKKKVKRPEPTPKAFFEDKVTKGCARGVLRHMKHNRLTIVDLPVGHGKTNISVMSAVGVAKMLKSEVQIAVLAPVTKRLDYTFDVALESAEKYYDVKLSRLDINNQVVGSFAGLIREYDSEENVTLRKKKRQAFLARVSAKPTIFILDETHLYLRNATSKGSKALKSIMESVANSGQFVKTIGLTATPTDNSILDTIGYLVANGDYTSKSAFYREEIVGFTTAHSRGLTMKDVDGQILSEKFEINVNAFINLSRVLHKLKYIMYKPDAPRDFHIPENVMHMVKVELTQETLDELAFFKKLAKDKAFASPTEKRFATINAMTSDENMINRVISAINAKPINTPCVFYQTEKQRLALKTVLEDQERPFYEVNGNSHSYFKAEKITPKTAVLVQFQSGATAFEAKMSNTSIYMGLPDSSINFTQSLGRNTRRGQAVDKVHNYIFCPTDRRGIVLDDFDIAWKRILKKIKANDVFNDYFTTKWGTFEQ